MSKDQTIQYPQSTLDRLQEAHWQLHQMEEFFHFADPFRWSLNGFLRAIKEVPQLLSMEYQNHSGFPDWYRPRRKMLGDDPLLQYLFNSRDVVVHKKMLLPSSSGYIGITKGSKVKLGIGGPINPKDDSDAVIHKWATAAKDNGDFLGFFDPHDEDTCPCIERTWRLTKFPDDDIIDLSAKAWDLVTVVVADSIEHITGNRPDLRLNCLHGSENVKLRVYDRAQLAAYVYGPGSKAKTGPFSPKAMLESVHEKRSQPPKS